MKRVLFISAARSEYDLLAPVMRACADHPALHPLLFVCAAHLSPFHGLGIEQIRQDGFEVAGELETLLASESWSGRSLSFANLVEGLTRQLPSLAPDLLFVAGDREEALAAAIVGNFLRIPVAHLYGGDRCVASDVDELFRPAISKLAHLHFTACDTHSERLIRMGERRDRVWTVGASGLDRFDDGEAASSGQIAATYGVRLDRPYFLLIQHPASTLQGVDDAAQMRQILDGMLSHGHPVLCSMPNYDPGNMGIRHAIEEVAQDHPRLVTYHNLPRPDFVTLYRHCTAIAGNSSSIVLESTFVGVPGILIGPRQDLRERGANVIRVEAERDAVAAACGRALHDTAWRDEIRAMPSPFGDGKAGRRVAELLAGQSLPPDELLLKMMTY